VSRVKTARQLKRRVELFRNLGKAIEHGLTFLQFVQLSIPVLRSMLGDDARKVDNVIELAFHFDKFLNDGIIHQSIKQYLPEYRCATETQGNIQI